MAFARGSHRRHVFTFKKTTSTEGLHGYAGLSLTGKGFQITDSFPEQNDEEPILICDYQDYSISGQMLCPQKKAGKN